MRTQPALVHKGQSQATAQNSLLFEKVRGYLTRGLNGKWELNWPAGFIYCLTLTTLWTNEFGNTLHLAQFLKASYLSIRNATIALEHKAAFQPLLDYLMKHCCIVWSKI